MLELRPSLEVLRGRPRTDREIRVVTHELSRLLAGLVDATELRGRRGKNALQTGAAFANPPGHAQYVGTVTAGSERDTYGYLVGTTDQDVLCVVGPKQYFGDFIDDAENNTYGYAAALLRGTSCSLLTASKKRLRPRKNCPEGREAGKRTAVMQRPLLGIEMLTLQA
jgi:hypothetical protein